MCNKVEVTQITLMLLDAFLKDNGITTKELLKFVKRVRQRRRIANNEPKRFKGDNHPRMTLDEGAMEIADSFCRAALLLEEEFTENFEYVSQECKRELLYTLSLLDDSVQKLKAHIIKVNNTIKLS